MNDHVTHQIMPVPPPITRMPIMAGGPVAAIIPRSIDEAFRLAESICIAGLIPDDCKASTPKETAARVMMKIMKGSEVGFPPMTALSTIMLINNRPCIYGDGALALCQNHKAFSGCKEWSDGDHLMTDKSTWRASCEMRRLVNGEIVTTVRTFSWTDAIRAKLVHKGVWQQYPQRMLQMRARAWCIRDSFADALCGLGIVEEVQDLPTKPEQVSTDFLDVEKIEPIEQPTETKVENVDHSKGEGDSFN